MKRCPKCGMTYDNDSNFCQVCGSALEYILDVDPAINGELFEAEAADTPDTPDSVIGVEWEPAEAQNAAYGSAQPTQPAQPAYGNAQPAQPAYGNVQPAPTPYGNAPGGAGDGQWHTAPPVTPQPAPDPAASSTYAGAAGPSGPFRQDTDPNVGVANGGRLPDTRYRPGYLLKRRSVITCILLSVVTFGIYFLYWIVKVNDDLDELAGTRDRTEGLTVLAISFVTLGIYFLYWLYKTGEKADYVSGKLNYGDGFSRILYLVLGIFGLSIIAVALCQDTINQEMRNRGIA